MQLENGSKNCEKAFQRVYDECLEKIPAIANYIICSALKIDFICNVGDVATKFGPNICDPSQVIDEDFGNEYARLKEKEMRFMSEYSNISFNYQTGNVYDSHAIKILNETERELSKRINEKIHLMDYIFRIFSKLMILIYLKIIYGKLIYFT